MSLSVAIIDQQVRGLAERHREQLEEAIGKPLDELHARSAAFVALCVKVTLNLSIEESIGALTEGGNDFGVDAIALGEVRGDAFEVVLFQGKYHHASLEGTRAYPQAGVEKAVQAIRALFNPALAYFANPRLTVQAELIRARLRDGALPYVRFLLCSNGQRWKVPEAQQVIDQARFDAKTILRHVDHDELVHTLQASSPVDEVLRFVGRPLLKDVDYIRVLVGEFPLYELVRLLKRHGELLLVNNIRRFLGPTGNEANAGMLGTLKNPAKRRKFLVLNNGLTFTCDHFDYNGHQADDPIVHVKNLQLVNGGQTSRVVESVLASHPPPWGPDEPVSVLVRLLQLGPGEDAELLGQEITFANNNQTPVDLKDLHSNDELQKQLELSMHLLGYIYRRHRGILGNAATDINIGLAAEAVLAIWCHEPHHARARVAEDFNKVYDKIFTRRLNAAQVVIAVLLLRFVEKQRKRPAEGAPELVHYGAGFVAMEMGKLLLAELGCPLAKLTHLTFPEARALLDARRAHYLTEAMRRVQEALQRYRQEMLGPKHLVDIFQRGSLLEYLDAAAPEQA